MRNFDNKIILANKQQELKNCLDYMRQFQNHISFYQDLISNARKGDDDDFSNANIVRFQKTLHYLFCRCNRLRETENELNREIAALQNRILDFSPG